MRTTVWAISMLAVCIAVLGLSPAQKPKITKEQAVAICRKFLRLTQLPDPKQSVRIRPIPQYTGFKDEWDVTYSGEYSFSVHDRDGIVTSFTNDRRIHEQFKRTQDRSRRRFTTAAQVRPYALALAQKLGLKPQAKLVKLEFVHDGDPMRTDANRAGSISIKWRTKPFGYEFYPPEVSNGLGMTIDPVDGALVSLAQHWDVKIESHEVRITKARAIAAAEAVFRPYRKKHRGHHSTADQPIAKVELKYVVPNSDYESPYSLDDWGRPARLAYIVFFGPDNVWIDSATGKLLGGQSFI